MVHGILQQKYIFNFILNYRIPYHLHILNCEHVKFRFISKMLAQVKFFIIMENIFYSMKNKRDI